MQQNVGIYLAGPMRFTGAAEAYDREWRENIAYKMSKYLNVTVFNPMDENIVHPGDTGVSGSTLFGKFSTTPNAILHQDVQSISRSDIVFANLLSLSQTPVAYTLQTSNSEIKGILPGGYPHIGVLCEVGIAIATHKLLIIVANQQNVVHHPFIAGGATRVLPDLELGLEYLQDLTGVLLGGN